MKTTRNTSSRAAIQEIIAHSQVALSSSEIQVRANGICDRVTTYRILDRLLSEGLVHKVLNPDGTIKYAACHSCEKKHHHNHVHFSCDKCHNVTCIDNVEPTFSLPAHYTIRESHFTISGLCPRCSE